MTNLMLGEFQQGRRESSSFSLFTDINRNWNLLLTTINWFLLTINLGFSEASAIFVWWVHRLWPISFMRPCRRTTSARGSVWVFWLFRGSTWCSTRLCSCWKRFVILPQDKNIGARTSTTVPSCSSSLERCEVLNVRGTKAARERGKRKRKERGSQRRRKESERKNRWARERNLWRKKCVGGCKTRISVEVTLPKQLPNDRKNDEGEKLVDKYLVTCGNSKCETRALELGLKIISQMKPPQSKIGKARKGQKKGQGNGNPIHVQRRFDKWKKDRDLLGAKPLVLKKRFVWGHWFLRSLFSLISHFDFEPMLFFFLLLKRGSLKCECVWMFVWVCVCLCEWVSPNQVTSY